METGKKRSLCKAVVLAQDGENAWRAVYISNTCFYMRNQILYYALKAFEESPVQEIVLVVGKGEIEYCQKEIVEKIRFSENIPYYRGGAERYHSVYCGLKAIKGQTMY